ncbi:phenylacetaldehyde reductase-like isoform X1 [Prosopis cineraria]|uniref:phenylacetaldehyde reductase-like isoform X1 n=1 Tax=Prosopis cineraria TaxID=364024 RepID=UPI00240FFFFA|nr:phenylacetaldehyde reductase-like isoform X1 [Prosopis cineraria]
MGSNVEAGKGKVVCVTGASGFIASWLVKLLLLCGYSVRATVRDLNDWSKTEHLLKLEGAKERLNLIKANLLEEGSFDSAVEGCHGVFHTASPVVYGVKDPQTELIDPAVKGTLNVLKSCSKTSSTKRVVLTSSMAAVLCNGKTLSPEVIIDETWFSDPDICKGYGEHWSGYLLSKTLAEKAAWKFTKENNIDMVVLNPAMVIGPILQPTLNSSIDAILILLKGTHTFPNRTFGWINVKDVANAHIQAFEIPSASGRYCLAESVKHYSEIVKILHELYPTLQLPDKCEDDETFMPTLYQISKEKAKMLGMEFIPFEVSLKETVESFKEKKFVDF